jgi:hypothetical protein
MCAMSDTEPQAIVSEDEIQRALAEAESESNIPSLDDDGGAPEVVPVPVPVQGDLEPVVETVPAEDDITVAVGIEQDEVARGAPKLADMPPGFWARVYFVIDVALWAVNRPFTWLRPGARAAVGMIAVATIVVSLLTAYALPRFLPNRHLVTDIHRNASEAEAMAAAEEAPPEPAADEADAGAP